MKSVWIMAVNDQMKMMVGQGMSERLYAPDSRIRVWAEKVLAWVTPIDWLDSETHFS